MKSSLQPNWRLGATLFTLTLALSACGKDNKSNPQLVGQPIGTPTVCNNERNPIRLLDCETNSIRRQQNLAPLEMSPELSREAEVLAQQQLRNGTNFRGGTALNYLGTLTTISSGEDDYFTDADRGRPGRGNRGGDRDGRDNDRGDGRPGRGGPGGPMRPGPIRAQTAWVLWGRPIQELTRLWMNSPEQRQNLSNPIFRKHGIGRAGGYWVHILSN